MSGHAEHSAVRPAGIEVQDNGAGLPSGVDPGKGSRGSYSFVNPSLLGICRAMGSGLALNDVLQTILRLTIDEMRAQQGSILLFDEHHDELKMLASIGLPEAITAKGYIPRKGSIAAWVIATGEPLVLNERPKTKEYEALSDDRKIVTSMCVPLKVSDRVIGTLNLNRTEPGLPVFGEADLEAMEVLAPHAAICIENARLHESLLRNERMAAIGQTVSGISHCVKNVLTGMKGGVFLLRTSSDQRNWDMLNQSLGMLENSVGRVSGLVMDMLDYSKERQPELGTVDLRQLTSEIVEVTLAQASGMESQVYVQVDPEAATVVADEHQLFRCLLNLVQNGLEASPEGSTVTLRTERSEAKWARSRLKAPAEAAIIIRVTDEGFGIPEDARKRLFEPFFSTKGSKGTGLGLAVSRKLINEHGGELELTSAPGDPTEFAIYLPVRKAPVSAPRPAA